MKTNFAQAKKKYSLQFGYTLKQQ
uniref:Uncharacterized protein n=1 Tax=Anguilla anguilla TaxID=7936 RepID=A0A0E9TKJ5_ANGAN